MKEKKTTSFKPESEWAEQVVTRITTLRKGQLVALKRSFGLSLSDSKTAAKQAFYQVYHGGGYQEDQRHLDWLFVAMGAIATKEYGTLAESTEPTQSAEPIEPQKSAKAGKSIGTALKKYAHKNDQLASMERKLMHLLDLSLRHEPELFASKFARIVKLLHNHNQGIAFSNQQLIVDLQGWDSPKRFVQQKWISDFYKAEVPDNPTEESEPSTTSVTPSAS